MEQLAQRVSQFLQKDGPGPVEPPQAAALPHTLSRKTVKALLNLLRSYPGGLTEPIILTHMASLPSLKQEQWSNPASHAQRNSEAGGPSHIDRTSKPATKIRETSAAAQPAAADLAFESRNSNFLPLSKLIQANDAPGVGSARVAADLEGPPITRTAAGATACVSACVVRMECVNHGESGKTVCGRVGGSGGVGGHGTDGTMDMDEAKQQHHHHHNQHQQQQQQQQRASGGELSLDHPLQQQWQPNSNGHSGSCSGAASGRSAKASGGRGSGTGPIPAHVATAGSRCAWMAHLQDGSLGAVCKGKGLENGGADEATLGLYLHSGLQGQLLGSSVRSSVPQKGRKLTNKGQLLGSSVPASVPPEVKACTEGETRGAAIQMGAAAAGVVGLEPGAGAGAASAGAGALSKAGGHTAWVPWLEGKRVRVTGLVLPKAACKAHSSARNSSASSLKHGSTGDALQGSGDNHGDSSGGPKGIHGSGHGGGLEAKETGGYSAVRKAVPTKLVVVEDSAPDYAQGTTADTAAATGAGEDEGGDDGGGGGRTSSLPMQQGDLGVWDLGQIEDAMHTTYGGHHLQELVHVPGWVRAHLVRMEGDPAFCMVGSTGSQAPTQDHIHIAPDSTVLLHLVSIEGAQPMAVPQPPQQQQQQQQGLCHNLHSLPQNKCQLPLLLQGEQVQLVRLLQVGEQVLLYRPLLHLGQAPDGAWTLEGVIGLRLGPEPLIVVRPLQAPRHLQQQQPNHLQQQQQHHLQQQQLQQAVGGGPDHDQNCLQHNQPQHLQEDLLQQQQHHHHHCHYHHQQQQQQQQEYHSSVHHRLHASLCTGVVWGRRIVAVGPCRFDALSRTWSVRLCVELDGASGAAGGERGAGGVAHRRADEEGGVAGAIIGETAGAAGATNGGAADVQEGPTGDHWGAAAEAAAVPQQQQNSHKREEIDLELVLGEGSVKVIRQQLHVGYDLLLIWGKQPPPQQQQQQQQATRGRACLVWDEHASGAQLQSLAMLPALLTTPCLHAPLKVPLQSLVHMCLAQAEPPGAFEARKQGDEQQQQQRRRRQVQEQCKLGRQQQQQQLDPEQQEVHQQQPEKQEGVPKRMRPQPACSAAPGAELEDAPPHSKRHKPDPQDLPMMTRVQGSSSQPAHSCRAVGPFVCSVLLEDLQVDTQRVHRVCGRPVVQQDLGDLLAMMMESQEYSGPSQSLGRQEHSRPPNSPASMPTEQGLAERQAQQAQGILLDQQQQQQQQVCGAGPLLHHKESDSHEGLWRCEFCGLECAGAEVEWELHGSASLVEGSACLVNAGPTASWSTCILEDVPLSTTALHAVLGGVSAAAWRAMSAAEKQQWLSAVSRKSSHCAGHLHRGPKEEKSKGKESEADGQEELRTCGGQDAQQWRRLLACVCLLPGSEGRAGCRVVPSSDGWAAGTMLQDSERPRGGAIRIGSTSKLQKGEKEGQGGAAVSANKVSSAAGGGVEEHVNDGGTACSGHLQRMQGKFVVSALCLL